MWGKTAEAVNNYVQKGQRVYVAGRLVQNTWEGDDGQRRHRTEIHTQEVVFLDSNGNGNGASDAGDEDLPLLARPAHNRTGTPASQPGAAPTGPLPIDGGRPRFRSIR